MAGYAGEFVTMNSVEREAMMKPAEENGDGDATMNSVERAEMKSAEENGDADATLNSAERRRVMQRNVATL